MYSKLKKKFFIIDLGIFNIINYDEGPFPSYNDNFFEILHFCDDYPKTVKLLNGFSRYVYFHSKNTFDMFIEFFNASLEP